MNATITTPTTIDEDANRVQYHAQAFAAVRALDAAKRRIGVQLATTTKEWKTRIAEAKAAMLEPLRESTATTDDLDGKDSSKLARESTATTDDLDGKDSSKLAREYAREFLAVVEALRNLEALKAQAEKAKDAIKIKLASVEAAFAECMALGRDEDSDQLSLYDSPPTGSMSWASATTRSTTYAALRHIEEVGRIDPLQSELLLALGTDDIETVDLGLDAEQAIEVEPDEEDEDEVETTTINIEDVFA